MNGTLTVSVSGRDFSRTVPRPLSSRVMPAIALRLTMVERWICLKRSPSSRVSSSRIGVRSASGRCHYTVLPPRCAHTSVTSMRCPPKRFVLDSGTSRQVLGMARFRLCAGSEAAKPTTRCQLPEPE